MVALLLDQLGDEAGPAGLMARAEPRAIIAVEILEEEEAVAPIGIVLETLHPAEDRAASGPIAREERDQPK